MMIPDTDSRFTVRKFLAILTIYGALGLIFILGF